MGKLPPLDRKTAEAMAEVYKDMKVNEIYDYTKKYIDPLSLFLYHHIKS